MSETEYTIEIPQPWAHLVVTKQINCIPGVHMKPPQDVVGARVLITAKGFDSSTAQSLIRRFPHFEYPTVKRADSKSVAIWRPQINEPSGKFRRLKKNDYMESREFVPNPKYGTSEIEFIQFNYGSIGSALLAGWMMWDGGKKPSAQYKAPKLREGTMKVHKCAHGPIALVFQRISTKKIEGGDTLRPYERKE